VSEPLVSVIVAVKNGERYLPAALESVRTQDYPSIELIVVDGKSIDRTADIARAFEGARYILQEQTGLADAWNIGIDAAQGMLVAFLDADDVWTPNKLRLQVNYLAQHPKLDYVIAYFRFFLESGTAIPPSFKRELLERDLIGRIPGTLLARKSLYERIGKFKTDLYIASDVDWFARAKDAQVVMAILPQVVLHKRVHSANLSSDAHSNNRELLKILYASVERQRKKDLRDP
jgi:glycosyltransferase involved in cell wall biosynthesis